jgi:hypothetical protein
MNKNKNKGFFTNSISRIYKQKENYSHVHTHVPGVVSQFHPIKYY